MKDKVVKEKDKAGDVYLGEIERDDPPDVCI